MTENTNNTAQTVPNVMFNDGTEYPQLGLGTWQITGDDAYRIVRDAIELGYRHIDTAAIYKNEPDVGRAINDAVAAGDVKRDELFVTSKLWHNEQGADKAAAGFQNSLQRLDLDYLDLFLIHWPWPTAQKYVETFEVLAKIQGLGNLQSIGVSNFFPEVLNEIIEKTGIPPAVNQIELHPGFEQQEMRELHKKYNIVTSAWSPLGSGALLKSDEVAAVANEIGKSPAQAILRWHIQLGNMVIPKASSKERLAENIDVFNFELTEDQMNRLTALNQNSDFHRLGGNPFRFPDPVE